MHRAPGDGPGYPGASRHRFGRAGWGATLLTVTGIHLGAQLISPDGPVSQVSQVLLMPALAGLVLEATQAPRARAVRLVLAGIGFSWLGDSIPRVLDGDPGFLSMVGCFLLAQLCYIAAMWPWWRRSLILRPLRLAPYLLVLAALVVWCAPGAGALLAPVLVYALALGTMAVLSTGLGPWAAAGGALFLLSDSLIAVRSFTEVDLPGFGFWIMLTYVAGQLMLAGAIATQGSAGASSLPRVGAEPQRKTEST